MTDRSILDDKLRATAVIIPFVSCLVLATVAFAVVVSGRLNIGGMTVNERLHHFGLLAEFDAAVRARDKAAAIKVLTQTRFSPKQAEYTVSQVLRAPERYGY